MRMARENFRLMRGEISWISVFLSQVESYVFYAVHLLPVITMKLLSAVFAAFGSEQNSSDPMAILPDSDPRKVMVEKVDMQEFNNSISEKYKTPFISYIRVAARGNKQVENLASVEQALETMKSENQNRLVRLSSKKFSDLHSRFLFPESNIFPFYRRLVTSQNILSSREISMLYHLPLKISSAVIEYFSVPHIPAKKDFKNKKTKQALELGINYAREQSAKAYLSEENRKRHLVVTGQTGTGKSTILKRLMLQDIDARVKHGQKRGLLLLDPHEDFFRDILIRLPDNFEESNSLLIWDNANPDYAFGFNPIFAVGMSDREIDLTVDSNYKLIEKLIKRANPETGMGTTGKPMLINAMKTLMVFQNEWLLQHGDKELISKFAPTLIEIKTLFSNEDFRNTIIDGINLEKYEDLRSFWQETFPTYLESKNWQEIKQGFDNKISQITTGSLFATFAQSKSAFNIPAIISRSKILLVNLSSKHIGEEGMSLLGSLLMSKIWFEARRIEAEARRPFVVYADEFQNFATPDFAQALSEARKFKLELILAHQFFGQLPENIFQAVMGNVKSKIYYRAGLDDALIIAQELQGKILKEEAMEIPEYNANVKVGDEVFSIYVPEERKPSFTDTHIEDFIESEVFAKAKSKQQVARDIQTRRRWFTDGCPIDYELSTN
jgi:GTPase SAR1 family protein